MRSILVACLILVGSALPCSSQTSIELSERGQYERAATTPQSVSPPEAGTAHVDVTVRDGFGAPLTGATVKLTGIVVREATVNEWGAVAFGNLPDGRYDVIASARGLVSSVPRVIDLSGPGVTDIHLTLKPRGPRSPISDSCGGFNSRSIRTLGNGADLVLLVTVVHQESIEVPLDDFPGILRTFNDARVVRSFKRNALGPAAGAVATILQGGGRIDRGDYVDQHSSNSLPPLNIGDEYVLFVKFDDQGNAWILGSGASPPPSGGRTWAC